MRCYPKVVVKGQSFEGIKSVVIPSQSMSLLEIIKRFTRRESLPIEKEGVYAEDLGDLEKIANEDITERHERAAELKTRITKAEQKRKEEEEKEKAQKEQDEKDKADLAAMRSAKKKEAEGETTLKNPPAGA